MQKNNVNQSLRKKHKFIEYTMVFFIFTLLCVFSVSAENPYSQSKSVSLDLKNSTLKQALNQLEKNSDYLVLIMDDAVSSLSKKVDIHVNNKTINEILNQLLNDSGLSFSIVNRQITIFNDPAKSQKTETTIPTITKAEVDQTRKTIQGTVVDIKGEAVIGANIVEVGTNNGTVTDINGNFNLNVDNEAILRISFIGYLEQTVNTQGKTSFNIILREDTKSLDEVVVVGYGTQKKANLTGAVSSINVEDVLGSRPISDVGRGLQGTIPGLSVTISSGEVGSQPTLKIRGQIGSIEGSSNPLILVDNVEVSNLQLINPNDIESVSVLKDAAASSIYGSKAAFGVILVTTKKGALTESNEITYSNFMSWQKPFKDIEIAGIEGLEYTLDAHKNMNGAGPAGGFWRIDDESLAKAKEWQEKYAGVVGTYDPVIYGRDWIFRDGQKYGYRIYDPVETMVKNSAFSQNHNLSLNGRRKDTSYNLGIGYLGQKGMMKPAKHDDFRRYTGSISLNTKLTDFFSVRGGAMYSDATKRYPNSATGFSADPWLYLYRWSRLFPTAVKDHGNEIRDPYFDTKNAHDAINRNRYTNLNLGTTIDFTDKWDLKADYAFSSQFNQNSSSRPTMSGGLHWYAPVEWKDENGNQVYVDDEGNVVVTGGMPGYMFPMTEYISADQSYIYKNTYASDMHTLNIVSTYDLMLNDAHRFNFMLGSNIVGNKWESHWSQRNNLIDNNNPQFEFAVGTQQSGGGTNWDSQVGFFGRMNYSFMDKYLLEANLRYDGTSKFPTNLRWRWYPSFSGGWVITNESFMEPLNPVLSFAKLRGSWGVIGDQSVSNSLYLAMMDIAENNWIGNNGKKVFEMGNPNAISAGIGWQDIETINLGLDMRFFRNQLGFVFELYQRYTKNMIIAGEALPATYGSTAPKGNFGNLRTRGWEIAADYSHRFENGLRIGVNANLSDAITDITKAADWNTPWENRYINNTYTTGKRYGDIYGYVTDRLYQKGDFVYDENGNFKQTTIIWEGNAKVTNQLAGNNPVYQTYFEDGNQILLMKPGDVKFVDVNGDGYITPGKSTFGDPGDRVVIGNTTPRYEYGLRLDADYKGFDLAVFFQGVGKRSIWGDGQLAIPGYHVKDGAMPLVFAKNYWREDRTDAFYPRAWNLSGTNSGYVMVPQTRYLLDMSYFKIKNITFGYSIPERFLQHIYLKNARIYCSLENFITFDNLHGLPIDPEAVSRYSMLRSEGEYNLGRTGTSNPTFKSASLGVQISL